MTKAPDPPYLGPAAHTSGPGNKPINRIVIHSTVGPTGPGSARAIAAYFRSSGSGGSAHYVVDSSEVVQVVYDSVIAWHAPPNQHSLGIEMCDWPSTSTGKRWSSAEHQQLLDRTAKLTAQLCAAYDVPPVYRNQIGLRLGRHGVTTHRQVSLAFHQSTHWDPGLWPKKAFMKKVHHYYNQFKES